MKIRLYSKAIVLIPESILDSGPYLKPEEARISFSSTNLEPGLRY